MTHVHMPQTVVSTMSQHIRQGYVTVGLQNQSAQNVLDSEAAMLVIPAMAQMGGNHADAKGNESQRLPSNASMGVPASWLLRPRSVRRCLHKHRKDKLPAPEPAGWTHTSMARVRVVQSTILREGEVDHIVSSTQ